MFYGRFEIHNNTMVKNTYLALITMGARRGGRAKIGVPPPFIENQTIFLLYGWAFSYFFSMWVPFWYVFPLMGAPFHHVRACLLPFCPCGGLFAMFLYSCGGAFSPCEGLSAPFFSMWGPFCSHEGAFYGRRSCTYIYYNTWCPYLVIRSFVETKSY